MQKLDISNPSDLQKLLKEELRQSPRVRYLHRLHCVLLLAQGHSCYDLARWFGLNPRTIELWVHKFEQRGIEGLKDIRNAGRPSKLNSLQTKMLSQDIRRPPRELHHVGDTWNGELLKLHLYNIYKVELSVRQCQRLLKQLKGRDLYNE